MWGAGVPLWVCEKDKGMFYKGHLHTRGGGKELGVGEEGMRLCDAFPVWEQSRALSLVLEPR